MPRLRKTSSQSSRTRIQNDIAQETAVRSVFVIESARTIVVFFCVPVEARPALGFHFRHQPIDQELSRTGSAPARVNKQILQQAYRSERRRAVMNDIIGDSYNAALNLIFRHYGMNRSGRIHDFPPGLSCDGLGRLTFIKTVVPVPQL